MDPGRWQRLQDIFDAAVEKPPDDRPRFVREACADDDDLRREVESLLATYDDDPSYLEEPAGSVGDLGLSRDPALDGQTLGPYRIERRLGDGGMGAVYLAVRDDDQYHQRVAVKVVKRGMDSEHILHRFRGERQILASLDHPSIARLIDAGITDDGRPYFVMEYIDGEPVDEYCRAHQLALAQRLELFRTICAAVHYAHQNLVVHRDLKPSNILVSSDGQVKLLDFGIAKILDPEQVPVTMPVTRTEVRAMTPEYASPEQVLGQPITTASDVYSLGVLLYEVLTGKRPYRFERRTTDEIARIVTEETPPRPSTSSDEWRAELRGDLDTIVLMAMHRDPQRRYHSAEALSDDLGRHLAGHPVVAHADTLGYRVNRFVRRNRLAVTASVGVVLLVLAFATVTAIQSRRVMAERNRAESEQQKAERVVEMLVDMFEVSNPAVVPGGDTTTVATFLDMSQEKIEELSDQPEIQALMWNVLGDIYLIRSRYDEARPLLERSLAQQEAIEGPRSESATRTFHTLAQLATLTGQTPSEAESLLQASLARQVAVFGPDHLNVAQAMQDLAAVVSDDDEKLRLLNESLVIRREQLPPDHPGIASTVHALANRHLKRSEHERARELYEETLAILESQHPDGHPHIITVRHNLASAYSAMGEWDEAEEIFAQNVADARRVLGPQTLQVASNLEGLGIALTRDGRHAEAEAAFRGALDVWEHMLDDHWRVANAIRNVGSILALQRRYDEAAVVLERAVAMNERMRGGGTPEVAYFKGQLAMVEAARGREDDALRECRNTHAILQADTTGVNPLYRSDSHLWLGRLLCTASPAEAEAHMREALAIRRSILPDDHPRVAEARCGLAMTMVERGDGRTGEARRLFDEAYPTLRAWGQADPRMLDQAEAAMARLGP